MRDAQHWDERYRTRGWLCEPSSTVVSALQDVAPGHALDLAAGAERLEVDRLEEVLRPDEGGPVVELVLVARRPVVDAPPPG